MESFPADVSWNNVKAVLRQLFSLVPMITHAAMQLMYRYQQKGESLQEFNYQFIELIQAVTNHEHKDITDPVKIYMYVQNYLTLQSAPKLFIMPTKHNKKAIYYEQKVEREFLVVEGIRQMEFVM